MSREARPDLAFAGEVVSDDPEFLPCGHFRSDVIGVEYQYDHPHRYDGVSEWRCSVCGERRGRWSGRLLVGDDFEQRRGGRP